MSNALIGVMTGALAVAWLICGGRLAVWLAERIDDGESDGPS